MKHEIHIALVGNPNSGKTTLFNALTGTRQYVGNWPGVTVEKKEGTLKGNDQVRIVDLPGIYSLSPYTAEEVVAREYLTDSGPDVLLNLIDGANPERSLYLTGQLAELGIPMVLAVNRMDVLEKRGDRLNTALLAKKLGCPVVPVSALRETGLEEAVSTCLAAAGKGAIPYPVFSAETEQTLGQIQGEFLSQTPQKRWHALRLLERDSRIMDRLRLSGRDRERLEALIRQRETAAGDDSESILTDERYRYIARLLEGCYAPRPRTATLSDRIDSVVTNRFLAFPLFAAVLFLVYYLAVSTVGRAAAGWANDCLFGVGFSLFGRFVPGIPTVIENALTYAGCAPWLISLVAKGMVAGVGAVLGFVPQMAVLFLMLGFLEECGYMSRIAFILDRLLRRFGLSGKSFIPILVGMGCGVPGIMARRTIENERDRRITVMTTTFIPCGAKLPLIALLTADLFGGSRWVAPSAYLAGLAAIVCSGIILKKTRALAGQASPFVMEMPDYHLPTVKSLFYSVWERISSFVKKAGTVILLASVLIWAGSRFGFENGAFGFSEDMPLEQSLIGGLSQAVRWLFIPLGFGKTQTAIASLMGLVAKEEIVSVFGVLGMGELSALGGYSFLMFNLLCAPCFAAIGAIRREMNSVRWTLAAIGWQCAVAYSVSLCIYQFGLAIQGAANYRGFAAALAVCGLFVFLLLRRAPKKAGAKR